MTITGFSSNNGIESGGVVKQEKSPEQIRLDKINEAHFKLTELEAKLNDLGETKNKKQREEFRKQIGDLLEEINNLI